MPTDYLPDIIIKVIVSVLSTVAVAAATLLFKSVRNVIFYERVEYDLVCERKPDERPFRRSWSINWEDNRLDFEAGDISNTLIENAIFRNAIGKEHVEKKLHPSNNFIDIFYDSLGVKINSIVRLDRPSSGGASMYTLRLVIRRKRWK